MSMKTVTKAPDDLTYWDVTYGRFLTEEDVIVSAVVSIVSASDGSTIAIDHFDLSDTQVRVWVKGGAVGDLATISCDATTQLGEIKDKTFRVRIREAE